MKITNMESRHALYLLLVLCIFTAAVIAGAAVDTRPVHTTAAPAVEASALPPASSAALQTGSVAAAKDTRTVIFADGFESGDTSQWSNPPDDCSATLAMPVDVTE